MKITKNLKIAIIGLGYVGLPLAFEFSKKFSVVGFDTNSKRVLDLSHGIDETGEVSFDEFGSRSNKLLFSDDESSIKNCSVYIVTVPTPVDEFNRPDLSPLITASSTVGKYLKKDDVVIYESTVYPGATEEVCIPILEQHSGLNLNKDFYCGYSPERINPGDKGHRVGDIVKVTSGSTPVAAEFIDNVYGQVIRAGTHRAPTIRIAEAAKVIENTQRDLNIALINELSMIFNLMGIDTEAVLEAAGTKWNFLPFKPGLVGGHCIGVDPYYLTHKAQSIGYHPEVILAGRRVNDGMGKYVVSEVIKGMSSHKIPIYGSRILIMGISFKENCPDLRNSKVVDLVNGFNDYGCEVDVYDPYASPESAFNHYGIRLIKLPKKKAYDSIVIAVAHDKFKEMGPKKIRQFGKSLHFLYDLKCIFKADEVDARL